LDFYQVVAPFDVAVVRQSNVGHESAPELEHGHLRRELGHHLLVSRLLRNILLKYGASGLAFSPQDDPNCSFLPFRLRAVGVAFRDDFGVMNGSLVVSARILDVLQKEELLRDCFLEQMSSETLSSRPLQRASCSNCETDLYTEYGFADGTIAIGKKLFCVACRPH
jgi:hypothetical protein